MKTAARKGPFFITFEGGDGAGKSTLMHALAKYFDDQGITVVLTRQPGGTRLSEEIRDLLLHPKYNFTICPKAELFLFLAARAQNVQEVIIPSLNEDKVVMCDRFHDSTIAYQGFGQAIGEDDTEALSLYSADGLSPDLTLYLDVSPDIGLKRSRKTSKETAASGKMDRIEAKEIEFHNKVREAFLRIAKKDPKRFKIVDAHLSPKKVFEQAVDLIENFRAG